MQRMCWKRGLIAAPHLGNGRQLLRVVGVDNSIARQGIDGSQIILYRTKLANGSGAQEFTASAIEDGPPTQLLIGDHRDRYPSLDEANDKVTAPELEALEAFEETIPTTVAGLLAMVAHAGELYEQNADAFDRDSPIFENTVTAARDLTGVQS